MKSKTIVNIKPGQSREYEVDIPEFLSRDAVLFVNGAKVNFDIEAYGVSGDWMLKDKQGNELFKSFIRFGSAWTRGVKNGKEVPSQYMHFSNIPKSPGKLIVNVKATGKKPSISSDCQLVFHSFLEFGPMITMFLKAISGGTFFIAFICGLCLYAMFRNGRAEKMAVQDGVEI